MVYTLVPFTQQFLQPAIELFIQGYRQERLQCSCLPSRAMDDPAWIRSALQSKLGNPGVAIVDGDCLLAYMVTGRFFSWKGQQAAIVPEYCHGALSANKIRLYQTMYQSLAQEWVNRHTHLHLIGHFAHDTLLLETLYQLGFGALLAERLRDNALIMTRQTHLIKEEQDIYKLIDLHIEHVHFYPQSPIFLSRTIDRPTAIADLYSHVQNGDVFFFFNEQNKPNAYLIAGRSTIDGEGYLLQETNTAQIKSIYVRPEMRGKGIGEALIQRAIYWSQEQGYERVFVEHETANLFGGNFWSKFFTPYLYFSMRYIDTEL